MSPSTLAFKLTLRPNRRLTELTTELISAELSRDFGPEAALRALIQLDPETCLPLLGCRLSSGLFDYGITGYQGGTSPVMGGTVIPC